MAKKIKKIKCNDCILNHTLILTGDVDVSKIAYQIVQCLVVKYYIIL